MSQIKEQTINTIVKIGTKIQKHSPEILLGVGIVSGIGAAVMACKATLKVDEILDEAQENLEKVNTVVEENANKKESEIVYSEKDAAKDKTIIFIQSGVKLVKLYLPAIGLGALSITSILVSYNILNKRNLALIAAYNLIEKSYSDYRKNVIEKFGEEVDKSLRFNSKSKSVLVDSKDEDGNVTESSKKKVDILEDPTKHSDYARFFDEASPNWMSSPMHNLTFLKSQQQYANDLLHSRGHLFLNEVYDMLGIPRCPAGAVVGWIDDENGDGFVDFGIYDKLYRARRDFVNGYEQTILLDFNVDGLIWDKI